MDESIVFHGPEVVQDRNEHCLMDDFEQEIPGYIANSRLAEVLVDLPLLSGDGNAGPNLLLCYETLIAKGFFQAAELDLLQAWLDDLSRADGSADRN